MLPIKVVRVLVVLAFAAGCGGPTAVRGGEVAGLDDQAMGTGLDKRDLMTLLTQNIDALKASSIVKRWEAEQQPTLAVVPLRNETSEHVESALESLTSDIETELVNAGHVQIVSLERQGQIMEEIKKQHGGAFDPSTVASWGKQAGVRYIVSGKVFSTDEMFDGERRVQYSLFLQVIDVETSGILFQKKTSLTKAIIQ